MKIFNLTVLIFLSSLFSLQAQDTLYLFESTGGVVKYELSKLDSMTFSSSQTTTDSTTVNNIGSIIDIDGNVYPTVKIGQQHWTAKDLKTTRFSNGDKIATTCPPSLDITNEINPLYQWAFEGIECNTIDYGRTYTWFVAGDSRNVCPTGWHVPSDGEWTQLVNFLGGVQLVGGTTGGGKLKDSTNVYWNTLRAGSTNEVGFNAIGGGFRRQGGTFEYKREAVHYWTSTWDTTVNTNGNGYPGVYRSLLESDDLIYRYSHIANHGFHIRCVKD
jgi:uncharacterized protein (TIGR02145 family)